jgi:Tol biopolymer transport system component
MAWNKRHSVIGLGVLLWNAASAQVTVRVSVGPGGSQGNGVSGQAMISDDGRFVAFESVATNLVAGDTNGVSDAFVRDRVTGATDLVSVGLGGAPGNHLSELPTISGDGRFVAFASLASNLVAGDANNRFDVFVRDRVAGVTELVSVDSAGVQSNDDSFLASISADGRYVAFVSSAGDLVAGDTNGAFDVFVHDRVTGATERASVASNGAQADFDSDSCAISADGRFVVFSSSATNLVPGDMNDEYDVFLRDRQNGITECISVDAAGLPGNAFSADASISGDARFVVFPSNASDLVPGDTNGSRDTFLRDRQAGTTERVSLGSGGAEGDHGGDAGTVSSDGRYVAFASFSTNLVAGDTNGLSDVFVRDRVGGATVRVSVDSLGGQANQRSTLRWFGAMSPDGRSVAFQSYGSNLVPGDTNGTADVFVHDALGGPDFTSVCDPGVAGVLACPCSNPPSGSGRGCDNSAGTGGAILSAAGGTSVSSDSLVFTTSGEMPSALSIVLQGNLFLPSGVVYGQAVRCAGGSLKRLYTRNSSGGSLTAPDIGAGDPSVSARSAARGDVIQPGQSRWYLVYYRDPTVLGGCPATSTFNATQTGEVRWTP